MSLRLIHGKPGSGKSCFCVDLLSKMLVDWAYFKIKNDADYPRRLLTNIPLDLAEINKYISGIVGSEVDLSSQIILLSDKFFYTEKKSKGGEKSSKSFNHYVSWWEKFRRGDFIVIDEVHHYLPVGLKRDKRGKELSEGFTNYISTHRHRQHDLIFLSQHVDNIAPEVKKMTEVVFEVLNVKNIVIGKWPFTLPMSDIDVVREAFGYPVQLAHIRRGVCEARKIVYDSAHDVFVLSPQLFKMYRSHTMSKESLDRPSLKMSRFQALVWFVSRHILRFGFWFVLCFTCVFCLFSFFKEFPKILVNGLTVNSVKVSTDKSENKVIEKNEVERKKLDSTEQILLTPSANVVKLDVKILGFISDGLITDDGVKMIGDAIIYKGKEDVISSVQVRSGIVEFTSGEKFKK
jgi:hypothetical protein